MHFSTAQRDQAGLAVAIRAGGKTQREKRELQFETVATPGPVSPSPLCLKRAEAQVERRAVQTGPRPAPLAPVAVVF